MSVSVFERIHPLRKPKGFEPTVQRWSVALPNRYDRLFLSFYGVQSDTAETLAGAPFFQWAAEALSMAGAPISYDHARFVDEQGLATHIIAMYWIDPATRDAWSDAPANRQFWEDAARLRERWGYFRECLTVPVDRQETLYWQDYPAALSKAAEVGIYPTPYCGYYGAMRDRLPIAAVDALETPLTNGLDEPALRNSKGARWRIRTPNNLAVIRSAAYWGRCDDGQYDDFMTNLRQPLDKGMDYLRKNAQESGCCSRRYQQTCDATGTPAPEGHALGYFLSLHHLETWAEQHPSHHAIFSAAIARYKKYGKLNQLRTWHEVFVLPSEGQFFEYLNCAPMTGLLPYFEGEQST